MKLSVIIPTFHRNDVLRQCLACLTPDVQSLARHYYEVIVTDDGRHQTAKELIEEEYPWVRWVKGPQKGPAANRNSGAGFASGEWLIFTDDDCLPNKDWLLVYYQAILENPAVQVFEGRSTAGTPRKAFSELAPINEKGGFLPSCNFGIRREVFQQMRGFDQEYSFSFEDMDLHYRLKKQGFEIPFLKEALIVHPWRITTGQNSVRFFANQQQGIMTFIGKHPEVLESFNSKHFLAIFTKKLSRDFFPGLIRYRGRGTTHAFRELFFNIKMGFILFPSTLSRFLQKRSQAALTSSG